MACQGTHTHAHTVSTYSRHTVTNEHYCKHVDTLTHTHKATHTPLSPSLTPSIFLCLSPPEDYTAGYLTLLLQKNVAWRSSTLRENTTIHLPPSCCSLVAPSLSLFYFLFVSLHFSSSHVFSGVMQIEDHNGKPYPFCCVLTYSVT